MTGGGEGRREGESEGGLTAGPVGVEGNEDVDSGGKHGVGNFGLVGLREGGREGKGRSGGG